MPKNKPEICANCKYWTIRNGADWCEFTKTWTRAYAKACRLYDEIKENEDE